MRYLLMILSICFVQSSFAAEQICKRAAGNTPYKKIKIEYSVDAKGELDLKKDPKVTLTEGRKSTVMENTTLTQHEFRGGNGPRIDYILRFDDGNDWFDTSLYLDESDEAVTAYADFASDGPTAKGFYTCSAFPFKREP